MNLKTILDISATMKQESPVFIVGAPRSGTSILYRTLQRHSSFLPEKCPSKVNLIESSVFYFPCMRYGNCSGKNQAFNYMLGNQDIYSEFLASTQGIKKYQKLLIGKNTIYNALVNLKIPSLRESFQKVSFNDIAIRLFFYFAREARGVKRIVEKTPSHIHKLPEMKTAFPQAKFLFIYRHPVDVFSSYKRRLKVSVEELGMDLSKNVWLTLTPQKFCTIYSNYMNKALKENASNSRQFMMFKYESFIKDPASILSNICDFLGEPYEAEILPTKEVNDWKIDPYLFDEIQSKTKSWSDFVEQSDAQFIETELFNLMNKLDYEKYTTP